MIRMRRRGFLTTAASAAGGLIVSGCRVGLGSVRDTSEPDWIRSARRALAAGHDYLWSQQTTDGRFASATYGLLASGESLTPFALLSLLRGGPEINAPRSERIARAMRAMIEMRGTAGALGLAGTNVDYPCYATAMLLSCLGEARPAAWRALATPSIAWLRSRQFRADAGWAGHPAQGGWGMGDRATRRPPHAGHVDLSMTRRVVEGLRAADVPPGDPALEEARDFALRCQAPDGGFFYSPVELALNKGLRTEAGEPLGYGSATTDGLLCLRAVGERPDRRGAPAAAMARGLTWLERHHQVRANPGIAGGPMEPFAEAMRGYYRAGAARCLEIWGGPGVWREELARATVGDQRSDGSWSNPNSLQKEDDPIVATGFAIQTLASVLAASLGS